MEIKDRNDARRKRLAGFGFRFSKSAESAELIAMIAPSFSADMPIHMLHAVASNAPSVSEAK